MIHWLLRILNNTSVLHVYLLHTSNNCDDEHNDMHLQLSDHYDKTYSIFLPILKYSLQNIKCYVNVRVLDNKQNTNYDNVSMFDDVTFRKVCLQYFLLILKIALHNYNKILKTYVYLSEVHIEISMHEKNDRHRGVSRNPSEYDDVRTKTNQTNYVCTYHSNITQI